MRKKKAILYLSLSGALLLSALALFSVSIRLPPSLQITLSLSPSAAPFSNYTPVLSSIALATRIQANTPTSDFALTLVALIVSILTVVAAVITIYQLRNSTKLEKRNLTMKAEIAETLQDIQNTDKTTEEHLQQVRREEELGTRYRQEIRHNTRFIYLPLHYHEQPLEMMNIYVNLRVQRRTHSIQLEQDLFADTPPDPYLLQRQSQAWRDQHATTILDPEQAIRSHKHCMLIGATGSGKTTLLKYLTIKAVKRQLKGLSDLPVYVELGAFADSDEIELLSFIAKVWHNDYGLSPQDASLYLKKNLQSGNILLLLDGFDETSSGRSPQATHLRVYNAIRQLTHDYSQAFIVVTVNKARYSQLVPIAGFTELEVLKFRQQDIEQFVKNWSISLPDTQKSSADFTSMLAQHTRIRDLASNPLLLSLLVLLYTQKQTLPDKRGTLYKTYINFLCADLERYHNNEHEHNQRIQRLLAYIAWNMHTRRNCLLSKEEFYQLLTSFLPQDGISPEYRDKQYRSLTTTLIEDGWLKQQTNERYSFPHISLQAYFAAQYLVHPLPISFIQTRAKDPWWTEVVLFYAGLSDATADLVLALLEDDSKDGSRDGFKDGSRDGFKERKERKHETSPLAHEYLLSHEYLLLAGKCWTTIGKLHSNTLEKSLEASLLQQLHETRYSQIRQQATEILAEAANAYTRHYLLESLSQHEFSQFQQLSIVQALGNATTTSLLLQSLALLPNAHIDATTRIHIARALGMSGHLSIAHELLPFLTLPDLHPAVRTSIAIAIGQLGDIEISKKLLSLLTDRQLDLAIRIASVEALGVLGDYRAPLELQKIHTDPQTEFALQWRIAITMALCGKFSAAFALIPLLANPEYPQDTLIEIIHAFSTLGIRSLAFDLLPLLSQEAIAWQVRASIAYALENLGGRVIIPQLVELFSQNTLHPYVRVSICNVLITLGERSLLPTLNKTQIEQVHDPLLYRAFYIMQGKWENNASVQQLLLWLSNDAISEYERLSLLKALSTLRSPKIVPALLRLLATPPVQEKKLLRNGILTTLVLLAQDQATTETIYQRLTRLLSPSASGQEDLYAACWELQQRLFKSQ
jgi:HEAT repeat protein